MGYKGFDKDFKCRGKQYMENTVFEEKGGNICGEGMMHYCDSPFDVLDYYPLIDDNGYINTFAMVEPLSEIKKEGNKRATSKLKIGAKLEIKGFVKACIDFLIEKTKLESTYSGDSAQMASSGDYAQMASSGDYAKMASSGDYAQMASSGNSAQMASSGDYAQMASSGYYAKMASSGDSAQMASSGDSAKMASSGNSAKMASSGDYAQMASSGYYAKMASSGNYAKMASSGDSAQMASSGDSAKMASSGDYAVIMCAGINSIAKAKIGSWITLAEWEYSEEKERYIPVCVKTEQVDGNSIKEDTFYKLVKGKFEEVK